MSSLLKTCNGGDTTIDLTQGLVAHYLLNNNADDSFGSFDGTPSGGVDFQGDVARYDGTNTTDTTYKINTVDGADNPFTISLWYRRIGLSGNGTLVSGDVHGLLSVDDGIGLWSMTLALDMDNDDVSFQVASGVPSNRIKWFDKPSGLDLSNELIHCVVTYDGLGNTNSAKVYLNGVDINIGIGIEDGTYAGMESDVLRLGQNIAYSSQYKRMANGNMSNVRIYSEAKDQAFITALFEEGYYPKPLPLPTEVGLVAHYPLTGTAEDTTGNYDGVENGNTYVDDAEFGSVASVDGIDDYIETNSLMPTSVCGKNNRTVSMWFNGPTVQNYYWIDNMGIGSLPADYGNAMAVQVLSDGRVRVGIHGTYRETSAGVVSFGVNTHIVYGNIGTSVDDIFIYVNGIKVDNYSLNTTYSINTAQTVYRIAKDRQNAVSSVTFKVSDIRIYSGSLTVAQILDIYNYEKNFRPIDIDDGLVAYYPLASNSLDNYHNEYDGVDTAMTYDGLSAYFNGVNGYVDITQMSDVMFPAGNSWSFGVWTQAPSSEWKSPSISAYKADSYFISNVIELQTFNSGDTYRIAHGHYTSPTQYVIASPTDLLLTKDGWYNIFAVCDGTTIKLYLNGVLIVSGNAYGSGYDSFEAPDGLGRYGTVSPTYTIGKLAKARGYNKAITAEQLEAIYNSEKGDFGL